MKIVIFTDANWYIHLQPGEIVSYVGQLYKYRPTTNARFLDPLDVKKEQKDVVPLP